MLILKIIIRQAYKYHNVLDKRTDNPSGWITPEFGGIASEYAIRN